jgi:hypothetical protein
MQPRGDSGERRPLLFVLGGVALAVLSAALAAAAGPPYLSLGSLNPWIVLFAIGMFAALFATPFLIHARLGGELEADARWERALLWWGAISLAVLGLAVLVGLASGFDSGVLAGAIALVAVTEALLVLATLVAWLLSS